MQSNKNYLLCISHIFPVNKLKWPSWTWILLVFYQKKSKEENRKNEGMSICYTVRFNFITFNIIFCSFGVFVPLERIVWIGHHYRWKATNFDQFSALIDIVQWGDTPTVACGIHLYWSSPRTLDTQTYCWAFGNAITCFNELGPSQLRFEHICMRCERSNQVLHCRGILY